MKRKIRNIALILAAAVTLVPQHPVYAQYRERLASGIDSNDRRILRGSRNARVERLVSNGPVEDSMRVSGLTFRFEPTYEQSVELERFLEDQRNPSSPLYHQWLTPEQYAERFGLSAGDFAKVSDWLISQGFQIDVAGKSRMFLSFSGTAAQVRDTFGTQLHRYTVEGKTRYSNVRDAAVPAALVPLIARFRGLDNFRVGRHIGATKRLASGEKHSLLPADLAAIYNFAALYKKGLTGKGQKIVVAGESSFNLEDVRKFRAMAGLSKNDPKIVLVPGSEDPGIADDEMEITFDVQFAGGIAPEATVISVYATSFEAAVAYAVDQNLAPVISLSYAVCEGWVFDSGARAEYRKVAQQANAQGITWVTGSGDTGAAGCQYQSSDSVADHGLSVVLPASVPEVTAVGGTQFVEGTGNYWSSTNKPGSASALSYIPERAWNETATAKLLHASGGGMSVVFPKPSWQTGSGVPNGAGRYVPDVAFSAAAAHDPYHFIFHGEDYYFGGTSAPTPFFAGVLALLNQDLIARGVQYRPGLGNINPQLYKLAQTAKEVFHDITEGDNIVPCDPESQDCETGQLGYKTGPAYDLVTGLGSIDIGKLFEHWEASKSTPRNTSNVVVSVDPSPVMEAAPDADGYAWFYTVRVSETGGVPTTLTGFTIDGYDLNGYVKAWFGTAELAAQNELSLAMRAKNMRVPSDHVFAFAGVDADGRKWEKQVAATFLGTNATTGDSAMSLTSTPSVVVKIGKGDPNCSADHPFYQVLNLKELKGSEVKLTKFVAGGTDYSGFIAQWFGSQKLPAKGTLHASLCWGFEKTPVTVDYEVDGVDASGKPVQATLQVDFKDPLGGKSGDAFPRGAASSTVGSAQPAR